MAAGCAQCESREVAHRTQTSAFEPSAAAGVFPKRSRENELGGVGIETETLSERFLRDSRASDAVGSGLMDRAESLIKKTSGLRPVPSLTARVPDEKAEPLYRTLDPETEPGMPAISEPLIKEPISR